MKKINEKYILLPISEDSNKTVPIIIPRLPIHDKQKPNIIPLLPLHSEIKPKLYDQNSEEQSIKKNIRISRHGIIFS